jgi:5-methylcytosine-specific restriction endonuclease McrA
MPQEELPDDLFTIDHITPKSKGGRLTWFNAVGSCWKCNLHKGALSAEMFKNKLMFEQKALDRQKPLVEYFGKAWTRLFAQLRKEAHKKL